jgi:signal peptidase I
VSTVSPSTVAQALTPAGSFRLARALRRSLRVTASLTGWSAVGALTGVAIAIAAPKFLGGQALTVMSGSMEPAIHPGDVVLTERIAPLDVKIGDVITFRSPERQNRLLTHRVREVTVKGNRVQFVTKGDAVNTTEEWNVPIDASLARPKFRLWKLGYPLFWLNLPFGRVVLYVLPVLLVGGYVLVAIWRSPPSEPDAEVERPLTEASHPSTEETASEPAAESQVLPTNQRPRRGTRSLRAGEAVLVPAFAIGAYALFRVLRPSRRRWR